MVKSFVISNDIAYQLEPTNWWRLWLEICNVGFVLAAAAAVVVAVVVGKHQSGPSFKGKGGRRERFQSFMTKGPIGNFDLIKMSSFYSSKFGPFEFKEAIYISIQWLQKVRKFFALSWVTKTWDREGEVCRFPEWKHREIQIGRRAKTGANFGRP